MRRTRLYRDERGTAAIEFAVTAPVFFMLLFGVLEGGLMLWTKIGLQHGAELAARCATVNATACGSVGSIQNYAAQQAFGLNPPPSTFTVSTSACGNQVSASYTYRFLTTYFGTPSFALSAQACFPK